MNPRREGRQRRRGDESVAGAAQAEEGDGVMAGGDGVRRGAERGSVSRRRFLRVATYAVPTVTALDVALAGRVLAQTGGGGTGGGTGGGGPTGGGTGGGGPTGGTTGGGGGGGGGVLPAAVTGNTFVGQGGDIIIQFPEGSLTGTLGAGISPLGGDDEVYQDVLDLL